MESLFSDGCNKEKLGITMNILINTTIMSVGGGIQLADSIVRQFVKNKQHQFVLVYPKTMEYTAEAVRGENNVELFPYEMPKYYLGLLTGHNQTLDHLVKQKKIDVVFSVMGPSRWKPDVPHLVGFARCQAVIPESPYWNMISIKERLFIRIQNIMLMHNFRSTSRYFWTENEFISSRVRESLSSNAVVYTVTSNYNQVYDQPEAWDRSIIFPLFKGMTVLTIAANYPHKNLRIIPLVIEYLVKKYPKMKFRFVMTVKYDELGELSDIAKEHIYFVGSVTINQCPYMYEQCDVMFLPSLLECFSACYAEAMRMEKVILVPKIGFAEGLCKNAALYYTPTSIENLGEAIYKLYTHPKLCEELVANGKKQIKNFETYKTRAEKLLNLIEHLPELYK